jgi:hypothetical protein
MNTHKRIADVKASPGGISTGKDGELETSRQAHIAVALHIRHTVGSHI